MIKNITTSSPYLFSSGGYNSMPYVNMSIPSAGMMRYNGTNSNIEIYDGTSWLMLQMSSADISTSGMLNSAVEWVSKKMAQEAEWDKLASKNSAVKIALDNLEQAKRQLEITAHLAKEQDEKTTS